MPRQFLNLPPGFAPTDATVHEVASFRRESLRTTFEKIKDGRYQSYRDGRIRKIVFASVIADRDRAIAESGKSPPSGKRRVGRPRTKPQPTVAVGEK